MKFFPAFILIFFSLIENIHSQIWNYISPNPEFVLRALSAPDTTHLRALGNGNFHYSDNGGNSWTEVDFGRQLYSVSFSSPQEGWIVAESNRLYHTSDGGLTWDSVNISTTTPSKLYFFNTQPGYLVTSRNIYDSLFITTDGGQNWSGRDISIPGVPVFTDSLRCWSFIDDTLYKSTDAGINWSFQLLPAVTGIDTKIFFSDSLHGWISGYDSFMRTVDGGNTWQVVSSGMLAEMHFRDSLNGIITGCDTASNLFITNDGGITLTSLPKTPLLCHAIRITDSQDRYYLTANGNSLYSDNGVDWNVFAVNNTPRNPHTIPGGFSTYPPKLKFSSPKCGIYVTGDFQLFGGNPENRIYVTNDSTKSWKHPSISLLLDVQTLSDSLWFFTHKSQNDIYLCKSYDQLETYSVIRQQNTAYMFFTDSLHGVSGTEFTTDGGITWQQSIINGDTNGFGKAIFFVDAFHGWCLNATNSFFTTRDGGVTWDSIAFLPSSNGVRIQFTDTLHGIVELLNILGGGQFYRTIDNGYSWNMIVTPNNILDFHALDSLSWWMAGDEIYYTSDGGLTYQQQFDEFVHLIAFADSVHGYAIGEDFYNAYCLVTDQTGILNSIEFPSRKVSPIIIYPNPSQSQTTVSSPFIMQQVDMYDVLGRLVLSEPIENVKLFQLDISGLKEGVYLLKVKSHQTYFSELIIRK